MRVTMVIDDKMNGAEKSKSSADPSYLDLTNLTSSEQVLYRKAEHKAKSEFRSFLRHGFIIGHLLYGPQVQMNFIESRARELFREYKSGVLNPDADDSDD